jgi:hypothetical protein
MYIIGMISKIGQNHRHKLFEKLIKKKIMEEKQMDIDNGDDWVGGYDRLISEIDQLRTQLAACGVAVNQNTRDSIKDRISVGDYGHSASYDDVCKAVDREIKYREALKKLAKLGNGDRYGNSDGNLIAIDALKN